MTLWRPSYEVEVVAVAVAVAVAAVVAAAAVAAAVVLVVVRVRCEGERLKGDDDPSISCRVLDTLWYLRAPPVQR